MLSAKVNFIPLFKNLELGLHKVDLTEPLCGTQIVHLGECKFPDDGPCFKIQKIIAEQKIDIENILLNDNKCVVTLSGFEKLQGLFGMKTGDIKHTLFKSTVGKDNFDYQRMELSVSIVELLYNSKGFHTSISVDHPIFRDPEL